MLQIVFRWVSPAKGEADGQESVPRGLVGEKHCVMYGCPACVARRHRLHPSHARNGAPPLLCRCRRHEPGKWSCEACLRTRRANDPSHILEEGCRFAGSGREVARRTKKQFGQRAGAGPCRDPPIPVSGAADGAYITDDLGLDIDVPTTCDEAIPQEESLGTFGCLGRAVTKDDKGAETEVCAIKNQDQNSQLDVIDLETEDIDGYEYRLPPINVREQRVTRARRVLGHQVPAQSRRPRRPRRRRRPQDNRRGKSIAVITWYRRIHNQKSFTKITYQVDRCETERFQSSFKIAGAPSPQV